MFDKLVSNAIDFLRRSVADLEESPKYSVIHFCSAIEIFLKARLMLEHWSLIVAKPERADLAKFRSGDFQSVGINEAIERLSKIANEELTIEEKRCFDQIREHRNKLIHFFHPNYAGKPDCTTIYNVVAEQCKGWFYLHRLLIGRWRNDFHRYLSSIKELDQLMHRQREFLRAKFEALLPEIEKEKRNGIIFSRCFFCGFEANKEKDIIEPLILTECLVCKVRSNQLKLPCPKCGSDICVIELGEGECEACGTQIDIEYLIDKFGELERPGDPESRHAYCSECEYVGQPSVIPFGEEWLCLNCLTVHNYTGYCEWCGAFVIGDLADSFLEGCVMCDGRMGLGFDG